MRNDVKKHLLSVMDEIARQIESTTSIAREGCDEDAAQRYRQQVEEVLEHVANARAHILTVHADAEP
jgi:hypothetical protein